MPKIRKFNRKITLVTAIDYLAGVKPKSEYYALVSAKKPLLNRLIAEIEKETGVEYPLIYLYYPTLRDGAETSRGMIQTQEVAGEKGIPLHAGSLTSRPIEETRLG